MRIAMSTLSGIRYGGMTYYTNLLPTLARIDTHNEYHIFIPRGYSLQYTLNQRNIIFHECMNNNTSGLKRFLWEQFMLPRELARHKIDIMFTAKNITIFGAPCKTVTSIRNMEPLRYREYTNKRLLNFVSWLKYQGTKWSLRHAAKVVAVSQAVKEYLEKQFPWVIGKVVMIHNGNPARGTIQPGKLEEQPFILTASKFVAYANQLTLIGGYAQLLKRMPEAPPLWFAGGVHDQKYFSKVTGRVQELGLEQKIRFLGLVSHDTLLDLYRQAQIFVFPSTLEACPHTLIEAMACGVPIVSSSAPPMPEITADAALYFDPQNPEDIAQKMVQALSMPSMRQQLSTAAIRRAQDFTWEKTAHGLVTLFESL